ncbi:MAG: AAA family ATPase [Candidatus Magasanikbacteria bacterium CG11_big_fil_rev_8_21_14_0_20_43_7]|uniref:AAA family ATPase n=1 Tax=Candidatus Magasanikbacteria bacterium CG11_big_fil_rev_8_21_14_0_20_43_7 TaxID=1974654 RepID=A0A2H0N1Y3_9BACT|nr:MAG: AAA family ATPase [Candidatus Magasanikbacteria bacterium CG11_big_fil_rev_8_21_14_0_20_43_7]
MKHTTLDITPQFTEAIRLMEETRENVLITGRAGTGKSTLLNYFRDTTKKNIVVLAPTGVAAVNVRGQTIHSFFGFLPSITLEKAKKLNPRKKEIYKKLDTIVIDEISMVRADLLDCVDVFLRKWGRTKGMAFGGIQMIFIGDLYQLPPVVTSHEKKVFTTLYDSPYFFSSDVMRQRQQAILTEPFAFSFVELEKIYRQKEDHFIALLNAVRNNTITDEQVDAINTRVISSFLPPKHERYITLTTTNAMADTENADNLARLSGKAFQSRARMFGDVDRQMFPADELLSLKKGAQVMMLNNDSAGRWINGTIGNVREIVPPDDDEPARVVVELEHGGEVTVGSHHWDIYKFSFDTHAKQIISDTVGSFEQYPMRLAWAVTIHKAQGKTFDRVIVDMGRGAFTTGQTYVALSRCTGFNGLVLRRPVKKSDVRIDYHIVRFVTGLHYQKADLDMPVAHKRDLLEHARAHKQKVKITYLKGADVKSTRVISPKQVGEMEYMGKTYLGVEAFCHTRQDTRVFRVDRILLIEVVGE